MKNHRLAIPCLAFIGLSCSLQQTVEQLFFAQLLESLCQALVVAHFFVEEHTVEHISRGVVGYLSVGQLIEVTGKIFVLEFVKRNRFSFQYHGNFTHILLVQILLDDAPLFPIFQ